MVIVKLENQLFTQKIDKKKKNKFYKNFIIRIS